MCKGIKSQFTGGLDVTRGEGFKILESEYGKSGVKILHLVKHGAVHTIQELEVESLLTLATSKDYEQGDNSHIIATDTQKNTIYVLAKQHGITSPEEFGLLLVNHFISKYPWVVKSKYVLQINHMTKCGVDQTIPTE